MKLTTALVAASLAVSAVSYAAVVDPNEPQQTPAGGNPTAGIDATGAVGLAIGVGVIIAIAAGGGDDNNGTSGTGTGTGTN